MGIYSARFHPIRTDITSLPSLTQEEPDKPRGFIFETIAQLNPLDLEANAQALDAPKEIPIALKGNWHYGEFRTKWRWLYPFLYQEPGYVYDKDKKDPREDYPHRDFAGRLVRAARSDRYLHHNDGRLRKLYVACTDEIYDGPGTSTWRRAYIHKVAPLRVRIATWIVDGNYDHSSWNDWGIMVLRAFPAALAMGFCFFDFRPTVIRRQLLYAPVLYNYRGEAKVWSNLLENDKNLPLLARNNEIYRKLKPAFLWFLKDPTNPAKCGIQFRDISEWEEENVHKDVGLNYLFVAFSTQQFHTTLPESERPVAGAEEISNKDLDALLDIAETVCRASGIPAFWVSSSCLDTEETTGVFRIADILRGAQSMIIVVGKSSYDKSPSTPSTETLLRQWGTRIWTFPEVLLSPGRSINVYTRGGDLQDPLVVPKNQFPSRVWIKDHDVSRHLIDHFLGSINLSRLELASLALKCLYERDTVEYRKGDKAYALMGLLRLRPQVDEGDTAFQAFSRLSLANDSDLLLERCICTLPLSSEQPWHDMTDAYESQLWDITPYCQVAGIADNDTVIIDGAFGVSVRWKSFYPIYWLTGLSPRRLLACSLMEYNGLILFLSIGLMSSGSFFGPAGAVMVVIGLLLLLVFVYFWLLTPRLVRRMYSGKFHQIQAEMFAFEGHLNAATIERALFGGNYDRFSWSTNSSPLSRIEIKDGERIGIDPRKDGEVAYKIEAAKKALPGQMRIFTLVDTYNMQLTLFEAVNPPVAFMFCAAEGTFYRETVLRLPTTALDRMSRVPRFRLGLQRERWTSHAVSGSG
ncbi:hypothetical protein PT974_02922 [Cladobotryum mycophilum]|uniref:Uncharacterized protein n=1 Tax=Cladobotryum mycophilum TaxID=491253 RepID=A0ABR0SZE0_9HYPO